MRRGVLAIPLLWLASASIPAAAGEVYSDFCQTGLIAPLYGDVPWVEMGADVRITLPPPSQPQRQPHVRATYQLYSHENEETPLLAGFPVPGAGEPKVYLKINGQPVRGAIYPFQHLVLYLKRTSIQRWLEDYPEVAQHLAQVRERQADLKAFEAARPQLGTWLHEKMGLSQQEARTFLDLILPEHPDYEVSEIEWTLESPWDQFLGIREAINLRWRNEGLFLDPHTGRLVEYYDDLGEADDTSLVAFRHSLPARGSATIVLDYSAPMGWDNVSGSAQLQFALAQAKHWGHGYRHRDEVKVEIEVPRGWRKVRIRPAMDLVRSTPRGRVYAASFTRPCEDIYIALVP